jgi:flagellar hook-associated protein 3 FlgL
LYDQVSLNIQANQQKMLRTQEGLVSGKRVNRPSDDAVGASRAVRLRKTLDRIDQFARNAEQAKTFLESTETALDNVKSNLVRVQELVMQQLGGMQGPEGRASAVAELTGIRAGVLQAMNTKLDGRYIFSGFQSQLEAFDGNGNYQGIPGQILEVEIADGDFVAMNMTGDPALIDPATGESPIHLIDDIIASLQAGDDDALRDQLPEVSDRITRILNSVSDVGARSNRVETALADNEELQVATVGILSGIEDVDYVDATTRFAEQQRVLQATLETSARMIQTSFLDFLK